MYSNCNYIHYCEYHVLCDSYTHTQCHCMLPRIQGNIHTFKNFEFLETLNSISIMQLTHQEKQETLSYSILKFHARLKHYTQTCTTGQYHKNIARAASAVPFGYKIYRLSLYLILDTLINQHPCCDMYVSFMSVIKVGYG